MHEEKITAIMATHDPSLIDLADQVIELRDGRIVPPAGELRPPSQATGTGEPVDV